MRRMAFLGFLMLALVALEQHRPLRRAVDSKSRRLIVNSFTGMLSGVVLSLTEMPATRLISHLVEKKEFGLLRCTKLPSWAESAAAFLLLDYSIYLWHVMLHKLPLLWRFHVAHHIDRDLDALTAMRFHFGELLFSMFWRSGTIALLGIRPRDLIIWETFLVAEICFHHSNVRLPLRAERVLNKLVVTPRMHGIHHSIIQYETDSNWSSGLTIWDYLHRTLRLNVHQTTIIIGVPAYRTFADVGLANTLLLPFVPQRETWRSPDGRKPLRLLPPNEGQPQYKLIA